MRYWTFWEWVAYAALFVAAMIIAAETGVRIAPDLTAHAPDFMHSAIWGFAPIVLVVGATIILLLHEFAFRWKPRPTKHYSQTFDHARILIDGHEYYECKFENCKFEYNGGTGKVINGRVAGSIGFETNHSVITDTLDVLKALGALVPEAATNWKHHEPR
jgi:hypothetical protein